MLQILRDDHPELHALQLRAAAHDLGEPISTDSGDDCGGRR